MEQTKGRIKTLKIAPKYSEEIEFEVTKTLHTNMALSETYVSDNAGNQISMRSKSFPPKVDRETYETVTAISLPSRQQAKVEILEYYPDPSENITPVLQEPIVESVQSVPIVNQEQPINIPIDPNQGSTTINIPGMPPINITLSNQNIVQKPQNKPRLLSDIPPDQWVRPKSNREKDPTVLSKGEHKSGTLVRKDGQWHKV